MCARLLLAVLCLSACGKTGHLAETTITPGTAVTGRNGIPPQELPYNVQVQLGADIRRCADQASVTIPDDQLLLDALAGAALGVIEAHGTGMGIQGGFNGAAQAMDEATASRTPAREQIIEAAEWKASDCLKNAGWDAVPRYLYHGTGTLIPSASAM